MYTILSEDKIVDRLQSAQHQSFHEEPFPQFAHRRARAAAVLLSLAWVDNDWHILYTRRTDKVEHHKSQVSFPGGAADPGDINAEDTALREAQEEVGLHRKDTKLLGCLAEMKTVTNFIVTPVVAVFPWPYAFTVHTIEVDRVFMMPLAWLANRENWQEFIRRDTKHSVITYFPYDGELLWGVTARITIEFIRALGFLEDQN